MCGPFLNNLFICNFANHFPKYIQDGVLNNTNFKMLPLNVQIHFFLVHKHQLKALPNDMQ